MLAREYREWQDSLLFMTKEVLRYKKLINDPTLIKARKNEYEQMREYFVKKIKITYTYGDKEWQQLKHYC